MAENDQGSKIDAEDTSKEIAEKMLMDGLDIEKIVRYEGLSQEEEKD